MANSIAVNYFYHNRVCVWTGGGTLLECAALLHFLQSVDQLLGQVLV
jgi:hypothetical protein